MLTKQQVLDKGKALLSEKYGIDPLNVIAVNDYIYKVQNEVQDVPVLAVAVQFLFLITFSNGVVERKLIKGFWHRDPTDPLNLDKGTYSLDHTVLQEQTASELSWKQYIGDATAYLLLQNMMTYPETWQKLSGNAAVVNVVRYNVDTSLGKRAFNEQVMVYKNDGQYGHFIMQNIVQNATYEAK